VEDVEGMVLGKTHRLAIQGQTQCLVSKVVAGRPVAGIEELPQQRHVRRLVIVKGKASSQKGSNQSQFLSSFATFFNATILE
jgi:hypothetical protein